MSRRFIVTVALLLPMTVFPDDSADQIQDQLVWDFSEFTQAFSSRDWDTALGFVSPDTKASFGGDQGADGVMNVFGQDDSCHAAMTVALNQGCRKVGTGANMHCIAPPQSAQPDVVYLGARASFQYSQANNRWMAVYLICGGD